MAAELEGKLAETSELIQSSGGVFEVEHNGQLIFSKKACGRFPIDGEVIAILSGLKAGCTLEEAQKKATADIAKPPEFLDWFKHFLKRDE